MKALIIRKTRFFNAQVVVTLAGESISITPCAQGFSIFSFSAGILTWEERA